MIFFRFGLLLLATSIVIHSVAQADDSSLDRFVNETGNFEAYWPKEPDHSTSTSSGGKKTTHESRTRVDKVSYIIQAMELSAEGLSDEVMEAIAKQAIGQMREELRKKFKDQVTIDKDLKQHGHLAAEFGAPDRTIPRSFRGSASLSQATCSSYWRSKGPRS